MKNLDERFSTKNQRINIFIGSTSESAQIAHTIKSHFPTDTFNVDVWDEDVFESGRSNLDNLKKFSALYDFSIMVFVPDDQVFHRNETYGSIPPNIIFEYGLFLGRMGASKSFIIADKKIRPFIDKVFSDMKGISIGQSFDASSTELIEYSIKVAAESVKNEILENYKSISEISFLPSAALALGYFENFIERVSQKLYELRSDEDGVLTLEFGKSKILTMPFYGKKFTLIILLPEYLLDANHDALLGKIVDLGLRKIRIDAKPRDFPVYWKEQTEEEINQHGFIFYDFPTTLFASQRAIELVLRVRGAMSQKDIEIEELVGEKEIYNFIKAIRYKIQTTSKTYLRTSVEIVSNAEKHFQKLT